MHASFTQCAQGDQAESDSAIFLIYSFVRQYQKYAEIDSAQTALLSAKSAKLKYKKK